MLPAKMAELESFTRALQELTAWKQNVQRLLERRGTTADDPGRHATLYRNYLGRIEPGDRDLIVGSLVDKLGLVGTRAELLERLAEMERAGVGEIVIQPVVDPAAEMQDLAALVA